MSSIGFNKKYPYTGISLRSFIHCIKDTHIAIIKAHQIES